MLPKNEYKTEKRLAVKRTQLTFTCSKSTIEAVEKGVKICSKLTIKTPEQRH